MSKAGRWYIGVVAALGAAGLAYSTPALFHLSFDVRIVPLVVLAWVAGRYPVSVPGLAATVYLSETFFFTLVLLFGGQATAVWMAIDGLLISRRRKHREGYRVVFNVAEPVVSILAASAVFYWLYAGPPLSQAPVRSVGAILLPMGAMAAVYFLLNSGLTAIAMRFETGEWPYAVGRQLLTWFSLNYFGGASVAVLLAVSWEKLSLSALALSVPVVVLFWLMFKNWQERATDAERYLREQRELSARHLRDLHDNYMSTVEALAMAIDENHRETHDHVSRVRHNATRLAKLIGVSDEDQLLAIEHAALLHDIGKLRVPEHIWHKPGKLTAHEYEQIKKHAPFGADMLERVPFLHPAKPIVRHHHENWDGTGYPDGLKGEEIPLGARIIAVVDCYDALTDDREYRPAFSDEEAIAIIKARKGTMYDPAVTEAFLEMHRELVPETVARQRDSSAVEETVVEPAAVRTAGSGFNSSELSAALLALSDLAEEIGGHTPVDDLVVALGARLRQAVPCEVVVFYLYDQLTDDLRAVHAAGPCGEALKGHRLRSGEGLSGWVAVNRTTIVNSSGALDFAHRRYAMPIALDSALATPLPAGDAVVGVLTLYATSREAFTPQHQDIVEFAARQIGPALEEALNFDRRRMASLFDPETGLPNENYLERVLNSAVYTSPGEGPKPGVLLLAGDGLAADAADASSRLQRLASTCRAAVRVTDLVFRTGPEEVAVLMTDGTADAMVAVARRVAEAMRDDADRLGSAAIESTFALFPDDAAEPVDLLRAARSRRVQLHLLSQPRSA
jgi:GGDEF domain-containing protein